MIVIFKKQMHIRNRMATMKKNKLKDFYKNIFKVLLVLFSTFAIYKFIDFSSCLFNIIISIIIFTSLIIFFFKDSTINLANNEKIITGIFSLLLSSSLYIGHKAVNDLDIFANLTSFTSIIIFLAMIVGIAIGIYIILIHIINFFVNVKLKDNNLNIDKKRIFLISWLIIFICWIPYFLAFYPGIITSDSANQIYQALQSNVSLWNNHHPIIHTLLIKLCIDTGKLLSFDANGTVAIYSIIQMVLLSVTFAYSITWLYQKKVSNFLLILLLIFYGLHPINGFYSITMWKDVLFGASILLLTLQIADIFITNGNNLNIRNKRIIMIISCLLVSFLRNNGIYIIILLPFLTMIMIKKYFKNIILTFSIPIILFSVVTGPLYNYLGISKSNIVESLSIPLQQVSRVIVKNGNITDEQQELIKKIAPLNEFTENYIPRISDPIKFYVVGPKSDIILQNKNKYFSLYLQLFNQNKGIYLDSFVYSTYGYWYPVVDWTPISYETYSPNYLDAYQDSLAPKLSTLLIKVYTITKSSPFINLAWGLGFYFMITIMFMIVGMLKGHKKIIIVFAPLILLCLTLLIATPVFAETRYAYGLFTTTPFLCILTLMINKEKTLQNNLN